MPVVAIGGDALVAFLRRGLQADDDGAVASPVTGTLASWKVEDGAEVAEGDTVAIVEAMKMETPIRAPRAGRIQLLVAETPASVTRGQAIARLGA